MPVPQPTNERFDYTGERFDPEAGNALAHYDHFSRYSFVRKNFGRSGALLDVGCGLGVGTRFLAPSFTRAVGVDPSEEAVSRARTLTRDPKIRFEVFSAFAGEPDAPRFEVVTCLEVVEHTHEQDALVALVRRHLADDGVAIFSTPNRIHTALHHVANPFHVRELLREEFQALMERHFRSVQLLAMVHLNGIGIVPIDASPHGLEAIHQGFRPEAELGDRFPVETIANFIAICGDAPRPLPPALLLCDPFSTYVEELQQVVANEAKLVDARDAELGKAAVLLADRDAALASQRRMIDERDAALAHQAKVIQARDESLAAQLGQIEERDAVMRSQDALVADRDAALAAQTRMIDERDRVIAEQGSMIFERDQLLARQQLEIAELGGQLIASSRPGPAGGALPLRYRVVDKANAVLKERLPGAHSLVRALIGSRRGR